MKIAPNPGETADDGETQGASGHHRGKDRREHLEALATPGAESSGTHSPQEPSEGATSAADFPPPGE